MNHQKIIKFTKRILDIMFFSGILVVITLPITLKWAGNHYSIAIAENYLMMLFVLGVSGALGVLIIGQLRKIMKTVMNQDCFVNANVKSLDGMGSMSLAIAVLFFIKIFFLPTPATAIIIITFFIAALFCGVLSYVFREAIRYKEENDLTI